MQTVVHVTHEAINKIGGIGAVLQGLLTSKVYLAHASRNILVGPFWPSDDRGEKRLAKLASVPREDMIIFAPEGETKATVTVFTDVTCFYCQKFHLEVPALNKQGVEVRYLAWPREGVGSKGYRLAETAWCAENRQDTLTRLKAKQNVPEKICEKNPVAAQIRLGQELGVTGTPALLLQDGTLIPGYQPANQLLLGLGIK